MNLIDFSELFSNISAIFGVIIALLSYMYQLSGSKFEKVSKAQTILKNNKW